MDVFIGLILVGAIAAFFVLRNGEALRFETRAPADHVIQSAVSQVGVNRRWTTATQTSTSTSFNYQRPPKWYIALPLLLFFIIPGIVYLILAGKKESLNVMVSDSGQARSVQVVSNGWRGKSAGRSLQNVVGGAIGDTVGPLAVEATPLSIGGVQPAQALTQGAQSSDFEAGWYPDPDNAEAQRYFDGSQWTEHRA